MGRIINVEGVIKPIAVQPQRNLRSGKLPGEVHGLPAFVDRGIASLGMLVAKSGKREAAVVRQIGGYARTRETVILQHPLQLFSRELLSHVALRNLYSLDRLDLRQGCKPLLHAKRFAVAIRTIPVRRPREYFQGSCNFRGHFILLLPRSCARSHVVC